MTMKTSIDYPSTDSDNTFTNKQNRQADKQTNNQFNMVREESWKYDITYQLVCFLFAIFIKPFL